jgi:hypothetical protein
MAWSRMVASVLGRLDSVIDGVPDEVQQRVRQPVEHPTVQFGVRSGHLPSDPLALGARQIADRSVQLVGDRVHRDHLGAHGSVMQDVQ